MVQKRWVNLWTLQDGEVRLEVLKHSRSSARAASIKSLRTFKGKDDKPVKSSTMPVRGSVPVDSPSHQKEQLSRKPSQTFVSRSSPTMVAASPPNTASSASQPSEARPAPQPVPPRQPSSPPVARTMSSRRSMSPVRSFRTCFLTLQVVDG